MVSLTIKTIIPDFVPITGVGSVTKGFDTQTDDGHAILVIGFKLR